MNVPGFEDVNWGQMFVEMLMALPCLIGSLLLWWKILKRRDRNQVVLERLSFKKIGKMFSPKNIKSRITDWFKSLAYWKWIAGAAAITAYIIIGIVLKGNNDAYVLMFLGGFLLVMFVSGIYSTEDVENTLLMILVGLLGSRHGEFFREFNIFYPICSFIVAAALFAPGELRKRAVEKGNKLKNRTDIVTHDRLVYYLSSGFFVTSIIYFLTSF